jgi:2-polyprenyl-3-methyl-5-hydroxy-6-metoxy-1,4-benzoquinol methylase
MGNLYNELEINIEKEHVKINSDHIYSKTENYLTYINRLLYKYGLHERLIDSGIMRFWYEEFSEYWTKCLGGRPIKFHDFFHLYSHYREKFTSVEYDDENDWNKFLYSWQRFENIYLTFFCCYKYALHPFPFLPFSSLFKKGDSILEYGCGIAPVVTSMIKNKKHYKYTIADIRSFPYHYAKYRLKQHEVIFLDIVTNEEIDFKTYDKIFLLAVLEHLPNPLEIIIKLTKLLNRNGNLIFDYVLSEGKGLDTKVSIKMRTKVLDYISDNYFIKSRKLNYEKSISTVIAIKK